MKKRSIFLLHHLAIFLWHRGDAFRPLPHVVLVGRTVFDGPRQPSVRALSAKPKRGSVVDSYRTVSVNCSTCGERLFRYKKKNGTKSNLIKCFVERIAEDCAGVLENQYEDDAGNDVAYHCPSCQTQFARAARIRGLPALKLVGGKTRMTKK